jgi:NADH-quinone oxidoreductase subunit G
LAALGEGTLGGLVVGGVDPNDTADPAATRAAVAAAGFVVALELRETEITRAADVVFPVAPVTDKAGTFVTWQGQPRAFDAVFSNPGSLPDLRVLAGIAEELGRPLGFRTVAEVRSEMESVGPWDGARPSLTAGTAKPAKGGKVGKGTLRLATWKQMVDLGSMQDGEAYLRASARRAVARVSPATHAAVGGGDEITVTGDRGSVSLPVVVTEGMVDQVVWVPANSTGSGVLVDVGAPGTPVTVKGAGR